MLRKLTYYLLVLADFIQVFEKLVLFLPLYRPFVNNFTKSTKALKELLDKKKFIKVMEVN